MAKIDEELANVCQKLLKELNRVEREREKKREEERIAYERRKARREYLAKLLYSEDSKAMTFIVPGDSEPKK